MLAKNQCRLGTVWCAAGLAVAIATCFAEEGYVLPTIAIMAMMLAILLGTIVANRLLRARCGMDLHREGLLIIPYGITLIMLIISSRYYQNALNLRYKPSSTIVAECMTEQYTGNTPPTEIVFLRPESWEFSPAFPVSHHIWFPKNVTRTFTQFYRYIIPQTDVTGMNIDCVRAQRDPRAYAEALVSGSTVENATQSVKLPRRLAFTGDSADTFYNSWPLRPTAISSNHTSEPLMYQMARTSPFFGRTTSQEAVEMWISSTMWTKDRMLLITSVQFTNVESVIVLCAVWMGFTMTLCIVSFAFFAAGMYGFLPHWIIPPLEPCDGIPHVVVRGTENDDDDDEDSISSSSRGDVALLSIPLTTPSGDDNSSSGTDSQQAPSSSISSPLFVGGGAAEL